MKGGGDGKFNLFLLVCHKLCSVKKGEEEREKGHKRKGKKGSPSPKITFDDDEFWFQPMNNMEKGGEQKIIW